MLTKAKLRDAFDLYFNEMAECATARTYWSLLHIVVCVPDICGALGSEDGEATGKKFIDWCNRFLADEMLSGVDWYQMRCKVLHQGRTTPDKSPYDNFVFGQPASDGTSDHRRVDGAAIHLDVGKLAEEVRAAIDRWFDDLSKNPSNPEAVNVEKNLGSLVKVHPAAIPVPAETPGSIPGLVVVNKTSSL
jgi:hypothetical protein